jgi:hypothetical protein
MQAQKETEKSATTVMLETGCAIGPFESFEGPQGTEAFEALDSFEGAQGTEAFEGPQGTEAFEGPLGPEASGLEKTIPMRRIAHCTVEKQARK